MKIIYFLLAIHQSLCQHYTQTTNLLAGDLVLHYTVEDQKFKFKLEGRADQQIGLAFSYDVSLIRDLREAVVCCVSVSSPGRVCLPPHQ